MASNTILPLECAQRLLLATDYRLPSSEVPVDGVSNLYFLVGTEKKSLQVIGPGEDETDYRDGDDPWVRYSVSYGSTIPAGFNGDIDYARQTGTITIQVFMIPGTDLEIAFAIGDQVKDIFLGWRHKFRQGTGPSPEEKKFIQLNLEYPTVSVNIGRSDTVIQSNVVIPFTRGEFSFNNLT